MNVKKVVKKAVKVVKKFEYPNQYNKILKMFYKAARRTLPLSSDEYDAFKSRFVKILDENCEHSEIKQQIYTTEKDLCQNDAADRILDILLHYKYNTSHNVRIYTAGRPNPTDDGETDSEDDREDY